MKFIYKFEGYSKWRQLEVLALVLLSVSPLLENSIRFPIILALFLLRAKSFLRQPVARGTVLLFLLLITAMVFASCLDVGNCTGGAQFSILNIYYPVCLAYGLVVSSFYSLSELLRYLGNIAYVGACFSLVGMAVIYFAPSLIAFLPSYTYGGYTHKTAFVFNILYADGFLVTRNAGFAREPGVFQMLLNIGVLAEIENKRVGQILRLVVLGIALVLTESTIGLAIYAFLILKMIKSVPSAKYLLLIVVLGFSVQIGQMISYQLTTKLVGSDSFGIRYDPMIRAFEVGASHFFGLGNTGYTLTYAAGGYGSFDSFSQLLMRYGYIPFTLICLLYLGIAKCNFWLFLILFLTSLSQCIWYEPLITTLLFVSFSQMKPSSERANHGIALTGGSNR